MSRFALSLHTGLRTGLRAGLRTSLSLLALAAALACQAGTPGVDEPPLPGTPPSLSVPSLQEGRLANGLRVVVAQRTGLPLVSVLLHMRQGTLTDPLERIGLASLTHDLRTRGAVYQGKRLSAAELAARAEALGGGLGTSTSWDGSTVSMTVATPHLQTAAGLLASVVRRPTLPAKELAQLKEQTADNLKFSLSNPGALGERVAAQLISGNQTAYGLPLTLQTLERISLADVQAQHRRQARPEQATLVLAGDISLAGGLALAQRHLGDWRASGPATPQAALQTLQTDPVRTVLVNLPGAGQSSVLVMAPMPDVTSSSPQRRVAQLASSVLGGGYSSRLNKEIRVKRGLSYGANSALTLRPEGAVQSASAQTKHASAAEVVQVMKEEIARLAQTPPSAQELGARQAAHIGGFAQQLETTAGLARLALDLVERQRPLSDLQQVVPSLLAVTPEQVQQFAASHWQAERLRTVVVGDLEAAGATLKDQDPQARVIQAKDLAP